MEVLIKDSNNGISYIVLISGKTEREYYIQKYCDHNKIKYYREHNPHNEVGTFLTQIEDGVYSVFNLVNMLNANDNQLNQLEALRADVLRVDLYILRFVVRDQDSPFHKIDNQE